MGFVQQVNAKAVRNFPASVIESKISLYGSPTAYCYENPFFTAYRTNGMKRKQINRIEFICLKYG